MKKKERVLRIKKANEKAERAKAIRELCEKIAWRFDQAPHETEVEGPYMLTLVDQISPWEKIFEHEDEDKWDKLFVALKTSFAFGFVLGQMFDIPEIDITPIKELLRETKALIYLPHEKAV